MAISFSLNAKPVGVNAAAQTRLLWVVREHFKLTGWR